MSIYQDWINAKELERQAIDARRALEDRLIEELGLPEVSEESRTIKNDGYKIKVTYRMNRTIDAEALQEIAAENGLSDHLSSLFRWKPDINMREWKSSDESITKPLLAAITTKPGRPSFAIEKENDNG